MNDKEGDGESVRVEQFEMQKGSGRDRRKGDERVVVYISGLLDNYSRGKACRFALLNEHIL